MCHPDGCGEAAYVLGDYFNEIKDLRNDSTGAVPGLPLPGLRGKGAGAWTHVCHGSGMFVPEIHQATHESDS